MGCACRAGRGSNSRGFGSWVPQGNPERGIPRTFVREYEVPVVVYTGPQIVAPYRTIFSSSAKAKGKTTFKVDIVPEPKPAKKRDPRIREIRK